MATVGIKTKNETADKPVPAAAADTAEEPRGLWARYRALTHEVRRGFIAEWTVTIVLLLFATTSLVQAFVIPSASMEGSLLIGDHVLVDKLTFAPPGAISSRLLPYRDVRRGDIIVFRYPMDIKEDYVKRAIGIPGDHIRLVNKQLILNGHAVNEPYVQHIFPYIEPVPRQFPRRAAGAGRDAAGDRHAHRQRGERRAGGAARLRFRHGRQPRRFARQPLLGFCAAAEHRGNAAGDLLVVRGAHRRFDERQHRHRPHHGRPDPLLH